MRSPKPTIERAVSTCLRRSALESLVNSKGNSTFWNAVSTGMRLYIWKMKPTWRARHSVSLPRDMCVISSRATVMLPAEGTAKPPRRLSSVVLPEPLGPMKATNSPCSTSRFSPCRTWISSPPRWYLLSSPLTLIKLDPFLTPSTRTIVASLRLLFHFYCLAVAQVLGAAHHQFVPGRDASHHFDIAATLCAQAHCPAFKLLLTDQEYDRFAAIPAHRRLGNQCTRLAAFALGDRRIVQERDFDAHIRQNPRVEFVE